MKRINKIATGGLLALALGAGGLGLRNWINEGKVEAERIRTELPSKIIQNDAFWNAENKGEAHRVYLRTMAEYAENELGYHRPGSASWMPDALMDVERNLIGILYSGEGYKEAFLNADSARRVELYNLTREYYGF